MKPRSSSSNSRHLSVVATTTGGNAESPRLTRAQVADRLGTSVSTVRRFEGVRLHPQVDENGVRWFDPHEVAGLAAERANEQAGRRRNTNGASKRAPDALDNGELAALVFERLEQRQSLAEIVIALRVTPETVRALFDQWTVGLTGGQLRMTREPTVPREHEIQRITPESLGAQLAALPAAQLTRISVGRYRGPFQHGDREYSEIVELGGFLASGPCELAEITRRFGGGNYRVTAYGFDPPGVRFEIIVEDLDSAPLSMALHRRKSPQ